MMTNTATTSDCCQPAGTPSVVAQQVVIVNGSAAMLGLLESAFDAGRYDVVFVEASGHAYSQIKRVRPDLVILCVHIDDADGFHVLSMLKLDDETRDIPVLTCTSENEDDDEEGEISSRPSCSCRSPRSR